VLGSICADCWKAWEAMEVKVLNEYRLNFMDPEHRAFLRRPASISSSSRRRRPRSRNDPRRNLTKRYGERVLLEDVSWHVKKKDRIGLSGPNGSGKTTLLRMLAGLEEPDEGQIRMASDTTIGYLPQDGIVHAGRTVYDEGRAGLPGAPRPEGGAAHDRGPPRGHPTTTGATTSGCSSDTPR
jgi:hypothetical protein